MACWNTDPGARCRSANHGHHHDDRMVHFLYIPLFFIYFLAFLLLDRLQYKCFLVHQKTILNRSPELKLIPFIIIIIIRRRGSILVTPLAALLARGHSGSAADVQLLLDR